MFQTIMLLAALASPGEAPTVTNKVFEVENKIPARNYAACTAHVAAGGRAILAVGVPAPPGAYYTATLDGTAPGLWECFPLNGKLMMQPVPQPMEGQPVRRFIRECVNGVCREVKIE